MSAGIFCQGCGQPLEVPDDYQKNKMRCPQCGVMCDLPEERPARPKPKPSRAATPKPTAVTKAPTSKKPPEKPRAVTATPPPRRPPKDDPDDGQPYLVTGAELQKCPECGKLLDEGAVLCMRCGLNSETGEKATRKFQPLERHWNSGWSFQARVITFVVGELIALASGSLAIWLEGDVCTFVVSFLTFTVMLGFLLGTWDCLDLERNVKGRVKMSKTWRAFFCPVSTTKVNIGEYESVLTGKSHDVTIVDWFMIFILGTWGLIPGIIFFYLVFFKPSFYVSLTRDHGNPAFLLYKGADEEQMKDIDRVVRDAGRWQGDLPVKP